MIWLDVCEFCGFKRKMEVAESNLPILVTVSVSYSSRRIMAKIDQSLRHFNVFQRSTYELVIPTYAESTEDLQAKWFKWVEIESYKR
jgi:hypothetical protein